MESAWDCIVVGSVGSLGVPLPLLPRLGARDGLLGVLDRGAEGVRRALLLRLWSDDVTLLADGPAELEAEDAERLRAAGVTIEERRVAGLHGPRARR